MIIPPAPVDKGEMKMERKPQIKLLSVFGEILLEDIPLLTRWMFENRMNIRHMIPKTLDWAKKNKDQRLFKYVLTKSTPLDIRDYLRSVQYEGESSKTPGKKVTKWGIGLIQKNLINEVLYETTPQTLQFWYHKASAPVFQEIFRVTHPNPDKWTLPWFQKSVFGGPVPEDSLIGKIRASRKSFTGAKEDLIALLDDGVTWHYLSQTWKVSNFIEEYLNHRRVHLRFVIEKLGEYKDKPELASIALRRLGLPTCHNCQTVQHMLTEDDQYKCQNPECGNEFTYERPTYAPRINVSVILSEVEKHLTPTRVKTLTDIESSLRMIMLDTAQRVLMKTVVDTAFIGNTGVLIDKSGSMETAIKLGIILGGLISARLGKDNVKMAFFDTGGYPSDGPDFDVPESVADMLYMRSKWLGMGGTHILPGLAELRKMMPEKGYDTLFLITDGKIHDGMYTAYDRFSPEVVNNVADALNFMNPKRVFYIKLASSEPSDPQLDVALKTYREKYGGSVITLEPGDGKDTEIILAIASYYRNTGLLAKLQGIRGDVLSWAEANWDDRKTLQYAKAIKCGNCGAPVPPDMDYCLHCGHVLAAK